MVVDDDLAMCGFLQTFLVSRGYGALTVTSSDEAVKRFHADRPSAVLLDVIMPGMDGLAALAALKKIDRDVPVIVMSGQGGTHTVVQAMKLGATDFICKPFEHHELEVLLASAIRQRQLSQEVATLRARLSEQSKYSMLFANSDGMLEVRDLIERVSDTDVTVLIRGESGTGKELVAGAMHALSPRADGPFVAVNCAALPETLVESELFGHEKGAFSGAVKRRRGRFAMAHRGTIFLDEIGDLSLAAQAKILRVLEDGEVTPVGGDTAERVDVRLLAATHKPLESEIAAGRFREDLFYRLNVVNVHLPPLRERGDDILIIAKYLLGKYAAEYKKQVKGYSPNAAVALRKARWAGNIRELENRIKKAVVLADKALLGPEDLDLSPDDLPPILPLAEAKEKFQRDYINEVLAVNNGNRTKTARDLGVDPRTIFRHLEKEDGDGGGGGEVPDVD